MNESTNERIEFNKLISNERIEKIEEQIAELQKELYAQKNMMNEPEPVKPNPPMGMVCWVWWDDNPNEVHLAQYGNDGLFRYRQGKYHVVYPDHWRPANGPRDIGWEAFGRPPYECDLAWFDDGTTGWVRRGLRVGDKTRGRIIYIEGRPPEEQGDE